MKKISAFLTALTVLVLSVSCSSSKESSAVTEKSSSVSSVLSESSDFSDSEEKPVLKISETEISYSELDHRNGTYVPVEYSVSGLKNGWASSGIHIAYDNRLEVEKDFTDCPAFEKGDASENMFYMVTISWQGENPPDEIPDKTMDNFSVITADSDNNGDNGVIAKFNFKVPADANAGDVYRIEFFRYNTDCFRNTDNDSAMEEYAFNNWQNGYIKITE